MGFILEKSDKNITSHAGLIGVGALLSGTFLREELDKLKVHTACNPFISNADVVFSYIGLLALGKKEFDSIEKFRGDHFFRHVLNLAKTPSSPTIRQRFDQLAKIPGLKNAIFQASANLLQRCKITPDSVQIGQDDYVRALIPLDIDSSTFDNSKTKKEGVSRTYAGYNGYNPIFAYLGRQGFVISQELRTGSTHCQSGTVDFLKKAIERSEIVTKKDLLLRMDAGNDSKDNIRLCHEYGTRIQYIIKRNLRRESKEKWVEIALKNGAEEQPMRKGKRIFLGSHFVHVTGVDQPVRIVYKVVERTILKNGQGTLFPEIDVETYWTSLSCSPEDVISLYRDHATSEQFHSEIKSDMDLERLPAGKFATNDLVLALGALTYNLLRIIGQMSLNRIKIPLRKKVQRRRIRSVIQDMIYLGAQFVRHGRQVKLKFGKFCPWFDIVGLVYKKLLI
jgi:hypothetical protein